MPLLERQPLLERLADLLDRAGSGAGAMVLVEGEAGAGKSALIQAFAAQASATARVMIGACDVMSTPRPLGPLFDVATALGPPVRRLLREPDRRAELFATVLEALSTGSATALIIEDAHWADDATIDLLRYLGRRIDRTRALLVVTYRDDEVISGHPLQAVLGDLATSRTVHRLAVDALSRDAVRAMAAGSGIEPDALYARTGGNAFYVTEVLHSGVAEVPPTVRDAVLTRAARVSPEGRAVLEAAAVIGGRIEPWLLAAVAVSDADAADACLAAGLLQARGDVLQFRHQLAQDAVYAAISPMRRAELHAATLAALRLRVATVADYPRLAHHADAAGDAEAVLAYAPEAGRRAAALGSHREAAAQFARALRHASLLSEDAHAELLGAWLGEGMALGELHKCIEATDALIGLARDRSDPLDEARWLASRAGTLVYDGRNAEADAAIDRAICLLQPLPPSPVHAEVWRWKASLCMLSREYEQSIGWARRAIELAERFDLPLVHAGALNAMGSSRLIGLDEEQGRIELERGLEIARAAGLDIQIAALLGNLGSGHGEIYRFGLAERYLAEGIALAIEHDLDGYRWYETAWLALTRMYQGRWDTAAEMAGKVLRAPTADTIARIMALIALGRVRARRGDPESWSVLEEALALAIPTNTLQRLAPARAARAETAWLAGRPDEARAEARLAFDMAAAYRHPWHIGELGYWLWKTGELTDPPPGAAEPWALQMAGDWQGAADAWAARDCPYEAARALAEADDEAALRAAFAAFDRLGARPAAAMVTQRLRSLGTPSIPRGARPATRTNASRLTAREAEVLALIVDGHANAEIAAELYISRKTVEHHVTAILAKLGVSSRREAVRAANRSHQPPANLGDA